MDIFKYSKALVPLLVSVVLWVLSQVGVTSDMRIEDALTLALTSGLVWLVPNRK